MKGAVQTLVSNSSMLSTVNAALDIMPLLSCASLLDLWRQHSFPELYSFSHDGILAQQL
jgi:hypothetical protein